MTELPNAPTPVTHHWQDFVAILKDRISKPCSHPTFVMYFLGIIVITGGFGLLEPIFSRWVLERLKPGDFPPALIGATYTYFIAIGATAAVDLMLSFDKRKYIRMFFLLCCLLVLLCALLAAFITKPRVAAIPAALGYFLALFLWWVGNADNANLLDPPIEPTAPIGANAKTSGDLTGFNT